jgi:DNA helicase-2/ATP-dependent DNA helicase PcrA
MTRAKRHLHVLVPQRFYVSQQPGGGDRHVYATLTRFIPPAVEQHFEAVGPLAAEPASPSAVAGLGDVRLDLGARLRAGWT